MNSTILPIKPYFEQDYTNQPHFKTIKTNKKANKKGARVVAVVLSATMLITNFAFLACANNVTNLNFAQQEQIQEFN